MTIGPEVSKLPLRTGNFWGLIYVWRKNNSSFTYLVVVAAEKVATGRGRKEVEGWLMGLDEVVVRR